MSQTEAEKATQDVLEEADAVEQEPQKSSLEERLEQALASDREARAQMAELRVAVKKAQADIVASDSTAAMLFEQVCVCVCMCVFSPQIPLKVYSLAAAKPYSRLDSGAPLAYEGLRFPSPRPSGAKSQSAAGGI